MLRLNSLWRLRILNSLLPLLMGFRDGETFIVRGQEYGSGFRSAEDGFDDQAVVDALPMWREPHGEFANQFFIRVVEVELDRLSPTPPRWCWARPRRLWF